MTRPDARGHFGVKRLKHKLSIDQFKSLCRELNIGAKYQQHLKEFFCCRPTEWRAITCVTSSFAVRKVR
ncbi:dermonecrotic toxin domain-containing protein [Pseudomonas lini]